MDVLESHVPLGVRANPLQVGVAELPTDLARHTGDEPSPYVPGREWKGPDAEVDSDDIESDSDSLDDGVEGENTTGETAATSSSRSSTP